MRFAQAIPYCRLALQPPCPPRRFSCCRASAPSVTAFPSSQLLQGVASTALGVRRSLPPIAALYSFTRSEEHTSELQSLMRISYAVFCLKKKNYERKSKNK